MSFRRSGFTLVEVLVATTIGAFIALVAVATLKAVTTSAEIVDSSVSTAAELRFASRTISRDLVNMYRPKNKNDTKFIGIAEDTGEANSSYMVFYTVSRTKARAEEPEGDVYEVEYYLLADEERSVLMRRFWPNPYNEEEVEPGGMLAEIAENIDVFEVRYFDGEEWSYEWPEDMEILPLLIEVNLVASPAKSGQPIMETLFVNLSKSMGSMEEEDEQEGEEESNG